MSAKQVTRIFLGTCIAILVITGMAKIASAFFASATILRTTHPFFQINYQAFLLLAGGVEIGIALYLAYNLSSIRGIYLICFLSSTFFMYRFLSRIYNIKEPCGCMGRLVDFFTIDPLLIESISSNFLYYMFIFSFLGAFFDRLFPGSKEG
jgi:hypothetical protein